MKKFLKVIGILVALGLLLLVIAAIALRIFLPPEKVKALIEQQITSKLHRQVKLGDVSVGVLSGLRVANFQLSESPDFSKGTFVSSDRFVVRVRLLPLLSKKISVQTVELVKPHVTIIRHADGKTYNFSDLTGSDTPSAAAPSSPAAAPSPASDSSSSMSLLVSRAVIQQGQLKFVDQSTANASAEIDNWNLKMKNFSLTAPVDVQTSFDASAKGLKAAVDFSGGVSLSGGARIKKLSIVSGASKINVTGEMENLAKSDAGLKADVTLENIQPSLLAAAGALPAGMKLDSPINGSVHVSGRVAALKVAAEIKFASLKFSADGNIAAAASGAPQLDLNWNTNEFALADVLRIFPAGTLPKEVQATGSLSASGHIKGSSAAADFTLNGQADKLDLAYSDSFHKPAGAPLNWETRGHYTPALVDVSSLKLGLGKTVITGQGQYKSGPPTWYSFVLGSENLALGELSAWVPSIRAYAMSGGGRLQAHITSATPDADVRGTMNLNDLGMKYEQAQISHLTGAVMFSADAVQAPQIAGQLDGKPLKISLNAKQIKTHPVVVANVDADTVDLSKLMPQTSATPKPGQKSQAPFFVSVAYAAETAPSMANLPMDVSGRVTIAHLKHDYLNAENLLVKFNLTDVTADLSKVGGTASMTQGKGNVTNLQKLTSDSKAAKIIFLPVTVIQKVAKAANGKVKLPALDQLPINSVVGDYTFKGGLMNIAKFVMDGPQLGAQMAGTVGLAGAQPLNLKVAMVVASGLIGGSVGAILQDDQGRSTVHLLVGGTVADPKVSLDTSETGKQTINALKKGVGSSLFKKLGIPVPGGDEPQATPAPVVHGQEQPTNAPTPEPEQPNKQQQQIQDLQKIFKGIFKK